MVRSKFDFFYFSVGLPDAVAFYPLTLYYRGYDVGPKRNPPGKLSNVRPAPGPDGRRGGAYSFLGKPDSFIEFPNDGKLDAQNSITLLTWVNPFGGAGPIFHYDPSGFGVHFWVTRAGRLLIRFMRRSRIGTQALTSRRLRPRSWSFVGATYNHRTGLAKLYVNEKLVVTKSIGRIRLSTNKPVRMGAKIGDSRCFRGWITCMQVYDQPLPLRLIRIAKRLCFKGLYEQLTTPIVEQRRACLVTSMIDYSLRKTNVNDAIFASDISKDKAQTLMN